ncbi:hypothetical protein I0P70_00125 [Pontibacter sp. FD36]|uniref:hypothetical protein n=1 Tax=Pontibacter sp. FD36 TaxID=2789860 RepID=UPI0018AA49AE|nr:hypothetical protein [Pontibacter sp. FD36]MBF8961633.1 hypothetical protein [Pontibacter sp. FD36]
MQLNKEEVGFIGKWAKVKEGGQWRYIITRGLLWGVLVGIFSKLFQAWDALEAWDTAALAEAYTSSDFFIRLLIYSTIGLGIHAYHWNANTKRYNQLKNMERRSQTVTASAKD